MPIDGWSTFAKQIIAELANYDEENKTTYAQTLDSEVGIRVLARIMQEINTSNKWEPVKGGDKPQQARRALN